MKNHLPFLTLMFSFIMIMIMCCCYVTPQQHTLNNSFISSPPLRCLPHISSALLQLKQEFVFDDLTSYSKMKFWKEGKDCCEWDGVTCSTKTGQLIGLDLSESLLQGPLRSNSSLFTLSLLERLNLAYNYLSNSKIPSSFGLLSRLTFLNLSNSFSSGQVPYEIALLSNMISLDLSGLYDVSLSYRTTIKLAQNMTNLEELHLDGVDLSSHLPKSIANLSSLISLSLKHCNLYGEFPKNIFHLPNIQVIDVSFNHYISGFLPINFSSCSKLKSLNLYSSSFFGILPYSIGNLKLLSKLDLSSCAFSGTIPSTLFTMPSLKYLNLGENQFTGPLTIPSSVKNLSCLSSLHLEYNNFNGKIPSTLFEIPSLEYLGLTENQFTGPLIISSSVKNFSCLSSLDLIANNINGQIPSILFEIPSLEYLSLEHNQFVGPLTIPNISLSSQLTSLLLAGNKLIEQIPSSIFEMKKLEELFLNENYFSGTIEMHMFSKLSRLRALDLSHNNLSVETNTKTNSTLIFKLNYLHLASCNITEFPKFLKTQNELSYLDLSCNKIKGKVPKWFFTIGAETLGSLNMSTNFIIGWEKVPKVLPWKVLWTLDLSHNNLSGEIPPCLGSIRFLQHLELSNNKFEGSIPSSLGNLTQLYYLDLSKNRLSGRILQLGNNSMFCTLSNLEVLDVSNNQLTGSIPQCLGSFSKDLQVLNMKENNFSGEMPQIFVDENGLMTLDLSHNQLEGMVPQSLAKCNELQILNLGHNRLIDTFPFWLQNLTNLQVLVLRSNKFHGPIWDPNKYMGFKKLQIVDLSFNHFNGTLSSHYFTNWSAIKTVNTSVDKSMLRYITGGNGYYQESLTVTNKGFEREMVRILTIFSCIDLSNNNFHGEISKSVGDLRSLIVLNLSSNNFEGHIPLSFGDLKQLESLDLSNNTLSGRIPQELATLTFLAYLNLSTNQLMGPIPQGGQFNTFENSSFYGNEDLCGPPLSKECENNDERPSTRLDDHESEFWSGFGWKAVAIGYACGFLVGVLGGYLFISKK
ncbi:hypothetical protein CsatA_003107 [Cannabis sativa]